ncbi:hypothetical protein BC936DRAFT_140206 [Jimgerdemannia flammicorona]|uniref:Uncharacterized protein n=1 Tax=Jimgerdemannia flammicorona TaxID=994334 RepID=A0A433AXA8_9FUNG|nr:hypothetical protein BC936DRAFT_140206 [Jimgerdemannia flammicorona]
MRLQKSIAWREMQPQPDDKENAVGFQPGEANGHHITGKELTLTQHLRQLRPHYRHCVRHFSPQPKSCLPTADEAGEILHGTENTVPLLQAQDAPTDAKFKEDDQENEWEDDQEGEREKDQEYELEAGQEYERKGKNVYIDVDDRI